MLRRILIEDSLRRYTACHVCECLFWCLYGYHRGRIKGRSTVLFSHISMHNTHQVTAISYQAMTLHRPEISVPGIICINRGMLKSRQCYQSNVGHIKASDKIPY